MATTRHKWGDRSGPSSPRAASTISGEQKAAKAAVVDEAALLAEDLCAASPQHGADHISTDRLVPQWRSAGSFASGSRPSSAPPSRRSLGMGERRDGGTDEGDPEATEPAKRH